MRRGRKRKAGRREPNGRLQRPSSTYRDPMAVALAQPHRKGNKDPLCESPLGRLIMRQELPRICFDNALNYAQLVRRLFATKGIPQPVTTGVHATADREMSREMARALQYELQRIEQRLAGISRAGLSGLRSLAVDEREALSEEGASLVLLELAAESS